MRKVIALLLVLLLSVTLCGCNSLVYKPTPYKFPGTMWVSEDPDIYFIVEEYEHNGSVHKRLRGEITVDGISSEIEVYISNSGSVVISLVTSKPYYHYDDIIIQGYGSFSRKKMSIKVTRRRRGWLDPSIRDITFIKEALYLDDVN